MRCEIKGCNNEAGKSRLYGRDLDTNRYTVVKVCDSCRDSIRKGDEIETKDPEPCYTVSRD